MRQTVGREGGTSWWLRVLSARKVSRAVAGPARPGRARRPALAPLPATSGGPRRHDAHPVVGLRQPDPLIYSQRVPAGARLRGDAGTTPTSRSSATASVVDQHALLPATTYEVVARDLERLDERPGRRSAGRASASSTWDRLGGRRDRERPRSTFGVKGAPGCPAFARVPWTTPPTPGHYCLQCCSSGPGDDAEPGNNLGQSNTDVKPLNSPRAVFTFRCATTPPTTAPAPHGRRLRRPRPAALRRAPDPAEVRRRHDPAAHPVPEGWTVDRRAPGGRAAARSVGRRDGRHHRARRLQRAGRASTSTAGTGRLRWAA